MVCQFNTEVGSNSNGLVGDLYYLLRDSRGRALPYTGVADYIDLSRMKSKKVDATFFFSNLSVVPEPFTAGFSTASGDLLKTDTGVVLTEYFALSLKSILHLQANDPAGQYQLGVLSDDGANLYVNYLDTGNVLSVANDGDHRARLACSNRSYTLDSTSTVPIQVDYYQGPAMHIALVLMWRKVSGTAQSLSDPECGVTPSSTDYFFNTAANPPAPMQPWNNLLSRGWKIVPSGNLSLPESKTNPCTAPPAPVK